MKAKHKLLKCGIFILIMFINIYLISFNKTNFKKAYDKSTVSTPNYVEIVENTTEGEVLQELEEVVEKNSIVYDNMTLQELSVKIDNSLNSTISGKGYLIASYSLEMGVDPYMATAIILQETGCKWECSYLVKQCNNVGGQKGSGCGSYSYFNSLDEGIIAFIDNLYENYISYGLTTPEAINPKYAEDQNWSSYVNSYIETIKAQ